MLNSKIFWIFGFFLKQIFLSINDKIPVENIEYRCSNDADYNQVFTKENKFVERLKANENKRFFMAVKFTTNTIDLKFTEYKSLYTFWDKSKTSILYTTVLKINDSLPNLLLSKVRNCNITDKLDPGNSMRSSYFYKTTKRNSFSNFFDKLVKKQSIYNRVSLYYNDYVISLEKTFSIYPRKLTIDREKTSIVIVIISDCPVRDYELCVIEKILSSNFLLGSGYLSTIILRIVDSEISIVKTPKEYLNENFRGILIKNKYTFYGLEGFEVDLNENIRKLSGSDPTISTDFYFILCIFRYSLVDFGGFSSNFLYHEEPIFYRQNNCFIYYRYGFQIKVIMLAKNNRLQSNDNLSETSNIYELILLQEDDIIFGLHLNYNDISKGYTTLICTSCPYSSLKEVTTMLKYIFN